MPKFSLIYHCWQLSQPPLLMMWLLNHSVLWTLISSILPSFHHRYYCLSQLSQLKKKLIISQCKLNCFRSQYNFPKFLSKQPPLICCHSNPSISLHSTPSPSKVESLCLLPTIMLFIRRVLIGIITPTFWKVSEQHEKDFKIGMW